MKKILAILVFFAACATAKAQSQTVDAAASQQVGVAMTNAIELTFAGTNSNTGNAVTMAFTKVADYANGVISAEQELKVHSNMPFTVTVKLDGNINYSGPATSTPSLPTNSFRLRLTANNTGGSKAPAFNNNSYNVINTTNKELIKNGDRGTNKSFKVRYKFQPGWAMPEGTYSVNVVYTATQA